MRRLLKAVRPGLWSSIALAAAVASIVACGSGESELTKPTPMSCGEGTVAVGSQCVPVEAGAAGGSAGAAGAAGTAEHGGAAGEPADAESPDGPSDAPEEGAPGPGDDPCPDEPIFLNCSDSCGPKSPECDQVTCASPWPPVHAWTDSSVMRIIIRTPSHPGMNQTCKMECDKLGEQPYASLLSQRIQSSESNCEFDYRAEVSPPWHIGTVGNVYDMCLWEKDWTEPCYLDPCGSQGHFKVFTSDPDAPARNVVIERMPTPGKCP